MSDEQMQEIQSQTRAVELALAEGIPVETIDRYTTEQIETLLKRLPKTKFMAGQQMVDALIAFKFAKGKLSKTKAQMQILASGMKDELSAATDRKAWADDQPEVEAAEVELIRAEANLKTAELRLEANDDLFTAVKKLAAIKIAQEQDARNAERYGGGDQ